MTTAKDAEVLKARLEEANERNPRTFPMGAFIGDDFVLSAVAMFFWFRDSTELLDSIVECEPALYIDPAEPEYEEVSARLAAIRDSVRPGDLLSTDLMSRLESALKGYASIRWWGSLEDLLSGEGEFEQEVRESLREGFEDDDPGHGVIGPEMVDDFVEFIRTYGV